MSAPRVSGSAQRSQPPGAYDCLQAMPDNALNANGKLLKSSQIRKKHACGLSEARAATRREARSAIVVPPGVLDVPDDPPGVMGDWRLQVR
jgi:hypothetical protein